MDQELESIDTFEALLDRHEKDKSLVETLMALAGSYQTFLDNSEDSVAEQLAT